MAFSFFRRMRPLTLSSALTLAKDLTDNKGTGDWYQTPINQLIDLHGDLKLAEVTEAHLNTWFIRISHDGYSPWTVDSYTRAVKAFFSRMVDIGHLEASPAAGLRPPKLPPKNPKDIKPANVEALLDAARYDLRDYTMIRMLYDSGCRVGELLSMVVSNVDFTDEGGRVLVKGKGNKVRWVFFGQETAGILKAYIKSRPFDSPDDLWLSKKGGSTMAPKALTKSGVYLCLRRIARRAGVKRFNPHSFRHAFAKRMIDKGMPMRLVQELMGHSDITVTMAMYANYDEDELQSYYHRFSDQRELPSSPLKPSENEN